jgi:hypothetical protein
MSIYRLSVHVRKKLNNFIENFYDLVVVQLGKRDTIYFLENLFVTILIKEV